VIYLIVTESLPIDSTGIRSCRRINRRAGHSRVARGVGDVVGLPILEMERGLYPEPRLIGCVDGFHRQYFGLRVAEPVRGRQPSSIRRRWASTPSPALHAWMVPLSTTGTSSAVDDRRTPRYGGDGFSNSALTSAFAEWG
jgi:hypothetical protein